MTELIECPFCGSNSELVIVADSWRKHYRVECEACKATGPEEYTKGEAIKSWNARVHE